METGKRVAVYYNLHTQCWSIQSRSKPDYGLVIGHLNTLCLVDVTFTVQPAGRAKVLREKRKNVHAYVVGTLVNSKLRPVGPNTQVRYNPYEMNTFQDIDGEVIKKAGTAWFTGTRRCYVTK